MLHIEMLNQHFLHQHKNAPSHGNLNVAYSATELTMVKTLFRLECNRIDNGKDTMLVFGTGEPISSRTGATKRTHATRKATTMRRGPLKKVCQGGPYAVHDEKLFIFPDKSP